MPAPTLNEEFLELVCKSGLVESQRLEATLNEVRARPDFPGEPKRLAALLVRQGVLTVFQAEQLLQGKWRRFTIILKRWAGRNLRLSRDPGLRGSSWRLLPTRQRSSSRRVGCAEFPAHRWTRV